MLINTEESLLINILRVFGAAQEVHREPEHTPVITMHQLTKRVLVALLRSTNQHRFVHCWAQAYVTRQCDFTLTRQYYIGRARKKKGRRPATKSRAITKRWALLSQFEFDLLFRRINRQDPETTDLSGTEPLRL